MDQFEKDIDQGLSAKPKYLPSKYFYDKKGDLIFQKIMNMEEYYLTDCEYEIFQTHKAEILHTIDHSKPFRLVEFGAGDGYKTKVLLKHFLEEGASFTYSPIDISENVIDILRTDLEKKLPDLKVEGIVDDYFSALKKLSGNESTRKVILFLGSNIGNFKHEKAIEFLKELYNSLNPDDILITGFDLKKDPEVVLAAYNDKKGITESFNLNLLDRINKELGGNVQKDHFKHYPIYNPETGKTKSFLISKKKQEIKLNKNNKSYLFEKWEPVFMEVSQKYDLDMIHDLANRSGFDIHHHLYDTKRYYLVSIWTPKKE